MTVRPRPSGGTEQQVCSGPKLPLIRAERHLHRGQAPRRYPFGRLGPTVATMGSQEPHRRSTAQPGPGQVVVEGFAAADFDDFYRQHHAALTAALVLALRREKLGREAVLQGFGRALHQWPSLQAHRHPEGWVLRAGLSWARRRVKDNPPLERPTAETSHAPGYDGSVDRALGRLDIDDRVVLVASHFLDWDASETGRALRLPRLLVRWRQRSATRLVAQDAQLPDDEAATRLARHLRASAATLELDRPAVEAVGRPARRRGVWIAAGAFVVVAALLAAMTVLAGGTERDPSATTLEPDLARVDPTAPDVQPAAVGALPGPSLGWARSDHTFSSSLVDVLEWRGGFVALEGFGSPRSIVRGGDVSGEPNRVWASTDGFTWELIAENPSGIDPGAVVYEAVAWDGGLVAVGVGQRRAATPGLAADLKVWTSPDGAAWTAQPLPLDPTADQPPGLALGTWGALVAAGDAGIAVAAVLTTVPAAEELPLDDRQRALLDEGFRLLLGGDGVRLEDPAGLVAAVIPYGELPFSSAMLANDGVPLRFWHSQHGESFAAAAAPPAGLFGILSLEATDAGFLAAGFSGGPEGQAFASDDGSRWAPIAAAGRDRFAVFGTGRTASTGLGPGDAPAVWLDGHRGAPTRVDLPSPPVDGLETFAGYGGPGGLFVLGSDPDDFFFVTGSGDASADDGYVVAENGGRRLLYDAATRRIAVVDVATGEEIFTMYGNTPGSNRFLPMDLEARTFTVLDTATEEPLITVTWEQWRAAGSDAAPSPPAGDARSWSWYSPDGRRWSGQWLDDGIEDADRLRAVAVGDQTVLVVVADDDGANRPWVGTPQG